MKEFVLFLREALTFYKETLGHPDPRKRTPIRIIIILMFCVTVLAFAYSYGGAMVTQLLRPNVTIEELRNENIEIRLQRDRLMRQLKTCNLDREQLLESYSKLVDKDACKVPPEYDQSLYDRLEELQ